MKKPHKHLLYHPVCVYVSHWVVSNSLDCSQLGSSVHGILQARTLEWVAISFSRSPNLRIELGSPASRTDFLPFEPLFSSVQSCPTLLGFPVHHQLPEFAQTHVHHVSDSIQPSHPPLSPYPPTSNLSQHQYLFQWVGSSHQVAKVLEFQLQHQSFQWIFRTNFL